MGKTRIIQELYERLRTTREDPYWPPLAPATRQDRGTGADPMPGRKLVAPPLTNFEWLEDALPTFGWWGLNCERMSTGSEMDVVQAVVPQLNAHTIPVEIARFWSLNLARQTGELTASMWRAVRGDLVAEGGGQALEHLTQLLGAPVPFAGTLAGWGVKFFAAAREEMRRQADLENRIDLGERVERKQRSVAEDLAQVLCGLAAKDVPAILVVEDAHLMGGDLAELLNQLAARRSAPVLVVATTWPETRTGSVYETWYENATAKGRIECLEVLPLGVEDLVTILREHAPRTDDGTAHAVVRRLANPHLLKLWLTTDATRNRIERGKGALVLGAGDLDDLPRDLEDVIARRWLELNKSVREALTWAVAANPDEDDAVCRFPAEEVARAVAAWKQTDGEDTRRAFAHAVDPDSWCVLEDESEFFTETLLAEHVRAQLTERMCEEEIEELRECVRTVLPEELGGLFSNLDSSVDRANPLVASWYLTLTGSRVGASPDLSIEDSWRPADEDDVKALAVAFMRVANDFAKTYRHTHAVIYAGRAITCLEAAGLEADAHGLLIIRGARANWTLNAGRPGQAEGLLEMLLEDMVRVLGEDHPDTLVARGNLASAVREAGDPARAAKLFETLLAEQTRVPGADHPHTLTTRGNLASAVREAGDPARAVGLFEALLGDLVRVLGADHPHTLTIRGNLASAVAQAGDPGRAAKLFKELLEDLVRVLGADHPDTLTTRGNLASAVAQAGDPGRAVGLFEALLEDRKRVLGADHPHTLDTRANLAVARYRLGQRSQAVEDLRSLLTDLRSLPEPNAALVGSVSQLLNKWTQKD